MTQPIDISEGSVTIAVCTFRRAALFDCLNSFHRLLGIHKFNLSVLVIDNDETDQLRDEVNNFSQDFPLPIKYIHAPSKNISIARNAALNAAETHWLLFIDDDEVADPNWVDRIMAARQDAHAIIGTCETVYTGDYPDWLQACDFHSNRPKKDVRNAYTSNALIDLNFVKKNGFQFRLDLGRTGGEDTVFFRQLHDAGGIMRACPEAIVKEPLVPGRATMDWVIRRKFRAGQTHGLLCQEFEPRAFKFLPLTAGLKMLISGSMWILTIPGTIRSRHWLARFYLHKGVLSYRMNQAILEEYG